AVSGLEKKVITRRDMCVGLVASLLTLAGAAGVGARSEILSSRVFDWNDLKVVPTKTGFSRKVVQQPTATLAELEIHITTLNPGETPHPPHQHAHEELLIVQQGTVESLVNGHLKRVGPGSVIFQASNQLHSIRNVGTTPATYHVIAWNSPGMLKK